MMSSGHLGLKHKGVIWAGTIHLCVVGALVGIAAVSRDELS